MFSCTYSSPHPLRTPPAIRSQLGLVLLHLSLHSTSSDTRRAVLAAIERSAQQSPLLINSVIRESLRTLLSRETAIDTANVEAAQSSLSKSGRLSTVLYHCVAFDDRLDISDREKLLVELIVLSHHRLAGTIGTLKTMCFPDSC